jgi:hypothetical protein
MKKKDFQSFRFSPDLRAVFASIEDLALIVDYKGSIVETNHPEKMKALFDDCSSLHEIMNSFGASICFSKNEEDYSVRISPIIERDNYLGCTLVAQNVTEIKMFERKMEKNNKHLEESNQKLLTYMDIGHVLEAEKARLKVLEEVQLGLIKKIENVIIHLQDIQRKRLSKIHSNRKEILALADALREAYGSMRIAIRQISESGNGVST